MATSTMLPLHDCNTGNNPAQPRGQARVEVYMVITSKYGQIVVYLCATFPSALSTIPRRTVNDYFVIKSVLVPARSAFCPCILSVYAIMTLPQDMHEIDLAWGGHSPRDRDEDAGLCWARDAHERKGKRRGGKSVGGGEAGHLARRVCRKAWRSYP